MPWFFSTFKMILAMDLSSKPFSAGRCFPFCILSRTSITKTYWLLWKALMASTEMIKWFLPLTLFMWFITFINLHLFNRSYMTETKPTWFWWMIILLQTYAIFASILLIIFLICVYQGYWLVVFLLVVVSLLSFHIRVTLAS